MAHEPAAPQGEQPQTEVQVVSATRRRLLQGGLGAAPVLLSVSSRPVMASGGQCVAPSSFTSLNVSGDNKTFACSGRGPDFWKQSTSFLEWPSPFLPQRVRDTPATLFDSVFGAAGGYDKKTLLEVLNLTTLDTGRDGLARHIVAALLNAQKGWTPPTVLGVPAVKAIWSDFIARGYFEPTGGVRWYADYAVPAKAGDGLIVYLKSTMPL